MPDQHHTRERSGTQRRNQSHSHSHSHSHNRTTHGPREELSSDTPRAPITTQLHGHRIDVSLLTEEKILTHGDTHTLYRFSMDDTIVVVRRPTTTHARSAAHHAVRSAAEKISRAELKHPHILALVDSFAWRGEICEIVEYADGGCLMDEILRWDRMTLHAAYTRAVLFARHILHGIHYLHSQDISHGDLSTDHVVIVNMVAKITGLSSCQKLVPQTRMIDDSQENESNGPHEDVQDMQSTTPVQMKPEMAQDIYSYGMIVWAMRTRFNPFKHMQIETIYRMIRELGLPVPICNTPLWQTLLTNCWSRDLKMRPSAQELLQIIQSEDHRYESKEIDQDESSQDLLKEWGVSESFKALLTCYLDAGRRPSAKTLTQLARYYFEGVGTLPHRGNTAACLIRASKLPDAIIPATKMRYSYEEALLCAFKYHERQEYAAAYIYYVLAATKDPTSSCPLLGLLYVDLARPQKAAFREMSWSHQLITRIHALSTQDKETCFKYLHTQLSSSLMAGFLIGSCLYWGIGVSSDSVEAAIWFEKAVTSDFPDALYMLGECYRHGFGVELNQLEAYHCYLTASEYGHAKSRFLVGTCYYRGIGAVRDDASAFQCYLQAAEYDSMDGLFSCGLCYSLGRGVEKDEAKAHSIFQECAKKGYADAQYCVARLYEEGDELVQDFSLALHYYYLAADQDLAEAQHRLGEIYWGGLFGEKDTEVGFVWMLEAAKQGRILSLLQMAAYMADSKSPYYNEQESFSWMMKAAQQGYAEAQHMVGLHYRDGFGVDSNIGDALEWLEKAAANGHDESLLPLAMCYLFRDENFPSDMQSRADIMGVSVLERAAEKGIVDAWYQLGLCFKLGQGVEKDPCTAFDWLFAAGNSGHASACFEIGAMYDVGEGVSLSMHEAFKWYEKASKLGHAESMRRCALYHLSSCGTEYDEKKGIELMLAAAELGNSSAQIWNAFWVLDEKTDQYDPLMGLWLLRAAAESGESGALEPLQQFHEQL